MNLPLTKIRSVVVNLDPDNFVRGNILFSFGPIKITEEKSGYMSFKPDDLSEKERKSFIRSRIRLFEAEGVLHLSSWMVNTRGKER